MARRTRLLAAAGLGLATVATLAGSELQTKTIRAYDEYIGAVRRSFDERAASGRPLADVAAADMAAILRDGRVLVQPAREDGIVGIAGGLVHHWRGLAFIPHVTLQEAVAVSQDYAGYNHVYEPVVQAAALERHGDRFRVLIRLRKSSGMVTAVLDVWSVVQYRWQGHDRVYSISDSERIQELKNAGKPDEEHLPEGEGRGYLWRASMLSRFAAQNDGVLVELENVGLSRKFPPLLGWIIGPIARRIGRSSVEDSLQEFRAGVIAAHNRMSPPASAGGRAPGQP